MAACQRVFSSVGVSFLEGSEYFRPLSSAFVHKGRNSPACLLELLCHRGVWSLATGLFQSYVPWQMLSRLEIFVFCELIPYPAPHHKCR